MEKNKCFRYADTMNSFKRNGKPAESRGRKTKGPENGSQLPKGSFMFVWEKFDK